MSPATVFAALQPYLQGLALLSLATFVLSLACIPWLVGLLPKTYFLFPQSRETRRPLTPGRILILILRNCLGAALFLAGVAMLFLPGQGLITMVLGLAVMSFPYKKKLIQTICRYPSLRHGLDWLRAKTGHEPFIWP